MARCKKLKTYSYRKQRLNNDRYLAVTKSDLNYLIDMLAEDINNMVKEGIYQPFVNTMLDQSKFWNQFPKDKAEVDFMLYLMDIKPFCRRSCFMDE